MRLHYPHCPGCIAAMSLVLWTAACTVKVTHEGDSAAGSSAAAVPTPTDSVAAPDRSISAARPDSVVPHADTIASHGEVADTGAAAPSPTDLAMLSAELIVPLPGVNAADLPDTFNERRGAGGTRKHEALDIMAPRGTTVLSAAPGRVLKLHTSAAGGLMVYAADSTERFILMYAHLDGYAPGLRDGLPLRRGQVIGYVGTTGNAPPNAPHLHFAIAHPRAVDLWWTGTAVDPRPLLQHTVAGR